MGKKKIDISDVVTSFKDVILRAGLTELVYNNTIIHGKNNSEHNVLCVPEYELWLKLLEEKDDMGLKELDITEPKEYDLNKLFTYAEDLETDWNEISSDELYEGKIFDIKTSCDSDYGIQINKELLPLKLKKAEFNNISYNIFCDTQIILAIKKKFITEVPEANFSIIRFFKVL